MTGQEPKNPLERVGIKPETLSGEDLWKEIAPNGVKDPRFGINGDFAYPPLHSQFLRTGKAWYSVVRQHGRIVGIAEVLYDPSIPNSAELRNVSVQKDLKGKGISRDILEEVCKFVDSKGSQRLYVGPATGEGTQRLVRQTEETAGRYGIDVYSVRRKF